MSAYIINIGSEGRSLKEVIMKKGLAVLFLVMIMCLLAACSSGEKTANEDKKSDKDVGSVLKDLGIPEELKDIAELSDDGTLILEDGSDSKLEIRADGSFSGVDEDGQEFGVEVKKE